MSGITLSQLDTREMVVLGGGAGLVIASLFLFAKAEESGERPGVLAWITGVGGLGLLGLSRSAWSDCRPFKRRRALALSGEIPPSAQTAAPRDYPSPVATWVVDEGILEQGPVLDWGSGQGADVEFYDALGFEAYPYDPYWQPKMPPHKEYGFGQMLFVLDVIESPATRHRVLGQFKEHLAPGATAVFSAIPPERLTEITRETPQAAWTRHVDGWITNAGAFFRSYTERELEDTLESSGFDVMRTDTIYEDDVPITVAVAHRA